MEALSLSESLQKTAERFELLVHEGPGGVRSLLLALRLLSLARVPDQGSAEFVQDALAFEKVAQGGLQPALPVRAGKAGVARLGGGGFAHALRPA
jgi:hypothetical protein